MERYFSTGQSPQRAVAPTEEEEEEEDKEEEEEEFPWQNKHSTRRRPFLRKVGLKFLEETTELLYLEHSFQRC